MNSSHDKNGKSSKKSSFYFDAKPKRNWVKLLRAFTLEVVKEKTNNIKYKIKQKEKLS